MAGTTGLKQAGRELYNIVYPREVFRFLSPPGFSEGQNSGKPENQLLTPGAPMLCLVMVNNSNTDRLPRETLALCQFGTQGANKRKA